METKFVSSKERASGPHEVAPSARSFSMMKRLKGQSSSLSALISKEPTSKSSTVLHLSAYNSGLFTYSMISMPSVWPQGNL